MTEPRFAQVRIEHDGVIATVVLPNPDKLNAIDAGMWQSLARVPRSLPEDSSLRCVIVCAISSISH